MSFKNCDCKLYYAPENTEIAALEFSAVKQKLRKKNHTKMQYGLHPHPF